MGPTPGFLIKTLLGVVGLIFYCEFLVFYFVQVNCTWPLLDPLKEDKNITSNEEPVKIMVIADTHLLGSRKGHWLDKLRREWQMYRAFQTAMTLHNPELVFVLGDLLDEGHFCSEAEFNYYIDRFYSLFKVPETTKMYIAVGNHDIGFHYWYEYNISLSSFSGEDVIKLRKLVCLLTHLFFYADASSTYNDFNRN